MDREEKKYQQIGFTIRTIYDAVVQGIADLDDLQMMFFKALPDMPKNVVEDKKSGEFRLSHHVDKTTGMYNGKQIFKPKN